MPPAASTVSASDSRWAWLICQPRALARSIAVTNAEKSGWSSTTRRRVAVGVTEDGGTAERQESIRFTLRDQSPPLELRPRLGEGRSGAAPPAGPPPPWP